MLITSDSNGWSTSTEGPWQLLFNDQYIIKLFETNLGTSTQEKLFVGTKEECLAKVQELNLPLASWDSLGSVEEPVEEPVEEKDISFV